ncbi:MAG: helix-turn-helix transcriptional regulator [Selenomonadaceae bacterium]|nr:helix-turn-helix transcriptional regulator [Selenomonadaceae bacterium]
MKTKNAFAFRDFDSTRILQRPFFKDFYFEPSKSDAQILESLSNAPEDSVDNWERKLYVIKATHERLIEFHHLIDRHNKTRLNKYNKKKSKSKKIKIIELQRSIPVMEYSSASLSVLELINKFKTLYCEIEKKLQVRYRKEFANRLKRARQALGLTQKQLGDLIQVSPQGFSLYERGERDVSVPTIIRLAKVLNMNGNQILGLE